MLSVNDHSRDSAGLVYVYPVISRRSGGLSIGINLNPNNACNWRCIYCQVPDLRRGGAPDIDLYLLRQELQQILHDALFGDFFARLAIPDEYRAIRDIAISGNGEATTAAAFPQVVELIGEICARFSLPGHIKRVLISNGSQARRDGVQEGLRSWAAMGGEMWFKLDSATRDGLARINGIHATPASVLENLQTAAIACPVWLQTCLFKLDGETPAELERQAYLDFLQKALALGIELRGVLLYGLARPSLQPEADRLSPMSLEWLRAFANDIEQFGLTTRVNP